MAIGSGNFGELLDPGIREFYGLEYNSHPEEYTKIFGVQTSQKAHEESLGLSGFGTVPEKTKGGSVTFTNAKQNNINRLTHTTFGLGFVVEKELMEDDQYNQIMKLPRALARSVRNTIEQKGANILNNGFDSTVQTGADGKELFATDHLLFGGGTWKNEPTNAADLDSTSLEQALIDMGDWVDDEGLLIAAKAKNLIVPTELAWTAQKLLGSPKVPEDANNAINPAIGLMPFSINHFLTDPDAWFIMTDVPVGLVWYWRRRPDFTMDNDFDTENAKWKTIYRCSAGWDDARGGYASPGA